MAKNSGISFEQVIADIGKKRFAPVYFLQGEEPYFIDIIAHELELNVLPEHEKAFNLSIFYGKETDLQTIVSKAKQFPMMAERQLIIVKEAQEIGDLESVAKIKSGGKIIEYNALQDYLQNTMPSTILVFCHKFKTLDGRKPLSKIIEEKALMFSSKSLYENELPEWIKKMVSQSGNTISDNAIRLLMDLVGNNLSRLQGEINKILINFTKKSDSERINIDTPQVLQFVGVSKEYNVFELQKALSTKNIFKANQIINYFAENPKDNPMPQLLGSLFSYFTKLLAIAVYNPPNEFEAAKLLAIGSPYIAKEYMTAAKNFNLNTLTRSFSYLRDADMASKGYYSPVVNEKEILQELIFKILH